MTVRVYRSSDPGAPALRGYTPGDMINLLNKCLVTGYGSQAGAGWTMPFTGTNLAAFKQGGGNGYYLRVDDTDATASGARSTNCVGYEAMTDVNTGSPNPFPTVAQMTAKGMRMYTYYNGTAANARAWKMVATEKWFYLFWRTVDTSLINVRGTDTGVFAFGDFSSYKPGDTSNCVILGDTGNAGASNCVNPMYYSTITTMGIIGYSNRNYDLVTGSTGVGLVTDWAKMPSNYPGTLGMPYPNPTDGGLYLAPTWISSGNVLRGLLPGVWVPCHNVSTVFNPGDQFNGSGALAGKTFEAFCNYSGSSTWFMEISNTW